MRKILFIAALVIGFSVSAEAQLSDKGLLSTADDTLASTGTANYPKSIKGTKSAVTFQVDVTKTSGTVGGTINWQRSISGTSKYVTVATTTITDATNQYDYSFPTSPSDEYRVQVINSSGSFTYRVYYLYRN